MKIDWFAASFACATGIAAWFAPVAAAQEPTLSIGSAAPALDVEHWVQDGSGKFKPVTKFEEGKVYVVEFWATWCGPCIQSMPHLAETQQSYADKGVQLISISDEDLPTVNGFLDREFEGEGDAKTYRELTSVYCLTTDPDRSVHADYMEAANQNGIPTAFIVGKDSKIEWIGHPMAMDEPLEKVVSGEWDREVYLAEFKAAQEAEGAMNAIFELAGAGKMDEALTKVEELLSSTPSEDTKMQLTMIRLQLLMQAEGQQEKFVAALEEAFTASGKNVNMALSVAFMVHNGFESGSLQDKALLEKAMAALDNLGDVEDGAMKAYVAFVRANLQHDAGDDEGAIKTAKEAMGSAPAEIKPAFEELLKTLGAGE